MKNILQVSSLFVLLTILAAPCAMGTAAAAVGEDDVHARIRKLTKVRSIGGASLADLGLKFVEPRRDKSSPFLVGGLNTTETILGLKSLNGIAIESLERQMRPGAPGNAGSIAGFLGRSERLLEIMAADNRFVQNLGLTHQELVRPLLLLGYYARKNHRGSEITLGGLTFTVRAKVYTTPQYSPFHDGTAEGTDVTIINKKTGCGLTYSLLVPLMIERYGFYEGKGTSYRVDPRMIIDILRTEKSPEAGGHQRLPFEPANDRELAQALAVCVPSELIELNLWRQDITDEGVAGISKLENLKRLNLSDSKITDQSLEGIARLANLEELGLAGTQISDEGLRHLAGLKKLTMLNLTRTGVSDEGVGALAKMADLRELHVSETKVTDHGLKALMSLNALRELSLLRTEVTDQGLLMLSKLPSLSRVHTYGTKVTKEGQKEFKRRVLERRSGGR